MVSSPVPPSTVIWISAARLPVAEKRVVAAVGVEGQVLGGADVDAERRRVEAVEPDAGAVGGGRELSAPLPPLTSTVSVPSPPSFRSVSSPGFQIIRSLPRLAEHLVVGVAAGQGVVLAAAEEQVGAALAEQRVVAGLAEEHVGARPAGQDVVAGAAEQVGPRQRAVGLVQGDGVVAALAEHLDQAVLATVAVPPRTATAPPLTRMFPAALRLIVIVVVQGVAEDGQDAGAGAERGRHRCQGRRGVRDDQDGGGGENDRREHPAAAATPAVRTSCVFHFELLPM